VVSAIVAGRRIASGVSLDINPASRQLPRHPGRQQF
jgi:hypothetical protein